VLPSVLGRLRCEVLAVNSAVDESQSVLSQQDVLRHQARLADLVTSSGADLGVMLDPVGERIYLVDDAGAMLDHATTLMLVVSLLVPGGDGTVAIPVSASREVARLAEERGLEVRWTKTSAAALMEAAAEGDVRLAGSPEGALIFPDFLPAADAMIALAKLLEARAGLQRPLSHIVRSLPKVHLVHEVAPCPWELKGTVMRQVMEHAIADRVELVDGVKSFHGDDWVLVLPDPEQPSAHVWAEGSTEPSARALAGTQLRLIRNLVE
jgi:mannose-1-phosphate guanylyltransferase/phosphomannomutase